MTPVRRRDALGAWAVTGGLMAALFWVSHRPQAWSPGVPHGDKLLHAAAYAVLAAAWYAALRCSWPWQRYRTHAWIAAAAAACYGITDEWHQSFVPGRDASLEDWLADALGAFLFALIAASLKRSRLEPAAKP